MVKIQSLEQAFLTAQDPKATDQQLLAAANILVSWGRVNLADQLLNRLQSNPAISGHVNRLMAASRQLRRSGVLTDLAAMQAAGKLGIDEHHEAFISRSLAGSHKVIIVFTGLDPRFWLSLMLLHMFLKRLKTHLIYLSDLRRLMFFDGLESVAKGYDGLLNALRGAVRDLGAEDVHVMAHSSGGFAGLRYAMDLKAKSFLGMSIPTDLSGSLQVAKFLTREELRQTAPHMFVDLKPMLAASKWPERIRLFCGEKNPVDPLHALHLADLPNVEVVLLKNYVLHDVMSGLLARGILEEILQAFVSPPPLAASVTQT